MLFSGIFLGNRQNPRTFPPPLVCGFFRQNHHEGCKILATSGQQKGQILPFESMHAKKAYKSTKTHDPWFLLTTPNITAYEFIDLGPFSIH